MRKTKKRIMAEVLAVSVFVAGSRTTILAKDAEAGSLVYEMEKLEEGSLDSENQGQPVQDLTAPVITGAEEGGSYDLDELTITVYDEFLELVTCNQEPVHTTGKTAELTMKYRNGDKNTFTIEAWDKAGNYSVCNFILNGKPESNVGQQYEISGRKGNNGWYTSPVTINALNGNKICSMSYGIYKDSISFTESGNADFFIFDAKTGRITKISLGELLIDVTVPTILGVEDGKAYLDTYLTVQVSDENLVSVTVNGVEQEIDTKLVTIELERGLDTTSYTIVAVDQAGLETSCTFTLEAIETLERGKQYCLKAGVAYYLGDGTWKLSRDTTVYNGNMIFYVDQDGIYKFMDK